MKWGVWCISTKGWVHEGEKHCLYDTQREAELDLTDFTLNKKDRERYKVKKYGRTKAAKDVECKKIVRLRTEGDGLAPLVSVGPH